MKPYFDDGQVQLYLGDCLDVLAAMGEASVDSIVTDPPYAIGFMGKEWDSPGKTFVERKPDKRNTWDHVGGNHNPSNAADQARTRRAEAQRFQAWCMEWVTECLRVLKPGGHLLAFGGTRTYHRLACAIEDAGFEIRDSVADLTGIDGPGLIWAYSQGFPKSLDMSKAIDRAAATRCERNPEFDEVRAWLRAAVKSRGLTYRQIDGALGNENSHKASHYLDNSQPQIPTPRDWAILKTLLGVEDELQRPAKDNVFVLFEREVLGTRQVHRGVAFSSEGPSELAVTAPATENAARWEGWGTALKPSWEPVVVARKPLMGTVAANVLEHGTGALNVDGCRTLSTGESRERQGEASQGIRYTERGVTDFAALPGTRGGDPAGRWPPNLILGEEAATEMDRQGGVRKSGDAPRIRNSDIFRDTYGKFPGQHECPPGRAASEGGASRFFPVFRPEQVCVLYGMLSGCERVSGAETTSPIADPQPSAAASAASASSLRQGAGRPEPSTSSAPIAESSSRHSPAITRATAPVVAPMRSADWNALRAESAAILCASCATAIVQSLAAMQRGQSPMPMLGLLSTDAFSERILTQNLALCAEALASSGTTSTTTALTTSLGCVVAAISACTMRESDSPIRRSGLPPFKYVAKAPSGERPRLEDGTAHPTVKPAGLIRWLCRLVTPPGGLILDPFAGSGTTAEAAIIEGFRCILIERDPKSVELIRTRLRKDIQPTLFGDGGAA